MRWLGRRLTTVRQDSDEGSVLVLALVFLMVFGSWIGIVLQFAATGQRITGSVRAEATSTYAGGGALDGAINAARSTLTVGTQAAGTATCFTLPAGSLDNATAVTVTCDPRAGSGAPFGGGSASQPDGSVLALSADATEGVSVAAAAVLPTLGDVLANKRITVPAGATLTSSGSVRGLTCSTAGTVTPACTVAAAGTATDPAWPAPSTAATPIRATLPACGTAVSLSPGIYRSAAALQTVLNCASAVVWFQPGTYFFDFRDAGTHELTVGTGDVVVGGAASGWTPGTTASTAVPYPTAAAPTTSACDVTAAGVDMVFGGDSRVNVTGGRMQLCALVTGVSNQHIVVRGLASAASVPSTTTAVAATSADSNAAGAWGWDTPTLGAVVDGTVAHVRIPNTAKGPSKLTLAGLGAAIVPADATAVTVTVTVTETVAGTGNTTLTLVPGAGVTPPTQTLEDCPGSGSPTCSAGAFVPGTTDIAAFAGLTAAQVNGMSFDVTVNNPNNSPVDAWIDGITVAVAFSVPVLAVSGTAVAQPYVTGSATTTAMLKASGATTVLALHGTVYAPASVVDLGITSVAWTVADRGVVVRHLASSMTAAAGYAGAMISVPALGQTKRRVVLTATDSGGVTLARADVTFANAGGTVNGTFPTVNEWTVG
ncbi:MAG: hypothetical protein QOF58_6884 [Pseudonocardiales bacterium]|nr:hypothetical protein [Pseudonocardiales bacterium]